MIIKVYVNDSPGNKKGQKVIETGTYENTFEKACATVMNYGIFNKEVIEASTDAVLKTPTTILTYYPPSCIEKIIFES